MSRLSITKRVLCSFIAAAMLLSVSGCAKKNSNNDKSTKTNIARKIVNYYSPTTIDLPEGLDYPDNISSVNGKIYVSGYKSSASAEKLTKILNVQTKELKDFDLSMIDAQYLNAVYMTDSKVYVSYGDDDGKTGISCIDRSSNQVISHADVGTDCYIMSMYEMNGKLYVVSINYTNMNTSTNLDIYGEDLKREDSVNISEKVSLDKESNIQLIVPDGKGSFYAIAQKYSEEGQDISLYKLSSSYEVEYTSDDFSDMTGYLANCFMGKNGNLLLVSQSMEKENPEEGSKLFINEIDSATGSVVNRNEVKVDESTYIIGNGGGGDYDFIFTKDSGIYGYTLADKKETKVIEFGDELVKDFQHCYSASICGNELFMHTEVYGDGNGQTCFIMDESGEVTGQIELPKTDGYIETSYIAPNGNIYFIESVDNGHEDEDGNWVNDAKRTIHQIDESGKEVNSFALDDIDAGEGEMYINNLNVKSDGTIYLNLNLYKKDSSDQNMSLAVINSDGSIKSIVKNDDMEYIQNVILTDKDDYICYYTKGDEKIVKIDYEKNDIGEEIKFNNIKMGMNYTIYPGSDGYDFYYSNSDAVYGCNIADDKQTEIINWFDSDITISPDRVCPLSKDKILCTAWDRETGNQNIYMLDRVDEETLKKIQSRQIITVAGVDIMYSGIADEITKFNKNNDKYRLQINDYGKYSEYTDNEYVSGAKNLNMDIAQGDIPDIVLGNYEVDMESYTSKGMFTDLLALMDKDEDISKEDYLENVFDMYTVDGKMFQLITSFNISTMIGKTADVGEKSGWSFDDFFKFAESHGNKDIFYKCSKEELLDSLVKYNIGEFVNFKEGKCDFDNDTFVKLIEFINENGIKPEKGMDPRQIKYGEKDEDYDAYGKRFSDKKCLLEIMPLNGFDYYNEMITATIGEPATLIGIPTISGDSNGAMISADTSIGIAEKSENKDGAWEFARELLMDDYQDGMNKEYVHTFPIKKSAFDKLVSTAQSQNNQTQIQGPDGDTVDVGPVNTKSAEMILDLAKSASKKQISNESITDIINEQVNEFFDGGQSAKEAASAIQSKVTLYLKEIN